MIENYKQSLNATEEFNYKTMTVKLILSDICEKLENDTDLKNQEFTQEYARHFLFQKIESKLRISIKAYLTQLKMLVDINHVKTKITQQRKPEVPNKADIDSFFKQNINEIINSVKFYNATD